MVIIYPAIEAAASTPNGTNILIPAEIVVQGNVTANQPIYFDNGVGITGTLADRFIGYAVTTATSGNAANLLLLPYSQVDYPAAALGDLLYINSSGNLERNTSGYLIGICLEATTFHLLDTNVNTNILKSVIDTHTTGTGTGTRALPTVTGSGTVKELHIITNSSTTLNIDEIRLTYDEFTSTVVLVDQTITASTTKVNSIIIPLDIKHRGDFDLTIAYDTSGTNSFSSTLYYKEGF